MAKTKYTKYVINKCYGGFGLSKRATALYLTKKYPGIHLYGMYESDDEQLQPLNVEQLPIECDSERIIIPTVYPIIYASDRNDISVYDDLSEEDLKKTSFKELSLEFRCDPLLVETVEELGRNANTCTSKMKVVKVPEGTDVYLDFNGGIEELHEVHRVWR